MPKSVLDDPLRRTWFRAFQRIASHRLFRAMAARQGVDVLAQCRPETEDALFHAIRACVACRHAEACRLWQEIPAPSEPYPAFCANASYWEACRGLHHR
jgi:hypothetical protein